MSGKPKRVKLSEQYDVQQPEALLARLLVERLGEDVARDVLAEYRAGARRYNRAARVEAARRTLANLELRERVGTNDGATLAWMQRRIAMLRDLIAHADEYVAGTWTVVGPRRGRAKKEDRDE